MAGPGPAVAGYIARWAPPSVSPAAATFARDVVTRAGPARRDRAKSLLYAAARPADWASGAGLEMAAEVLLHPSVTGRFAAHSPGLCGPSRRTLRTSLRFVARRVAPQLNPDAVANCEDAGLARGGGLCCTPTYLFITRPTISYRQSPPTRGPTVALTLVLLSTIIPGLASGSVPAGEQGSNLPETLGGYPRRIA
jgi:hypothetical protein